MNGNAENASDQALAEQTKIIQSLGKIYTSLYYTLAYSLLCSFCSSGQRFARG